MECVVSVNFRVLAQHLGTPLLSGDADKIIAFANAVAVQTRDQTLEFCARISESTPRVWSVTTPDPQTRIAASIRAHISKDQNDPN